MKARQASRFQASWSWSRLWTERAGRRCRAWDNSRVLGPKTCWRKALILRLDAAAETEGIRTRKRSPEESVWGGKNPAAARKYDAGIILNEDSFSQGLSSSTRVITAEPDAAASVD